MFLYVLFLYPHFVGELGKQKGINQTESTRIGAETDDILCALSLCVIATIADTMILSSAFAQNANKWMWLKKKKKIPHKLAVNSSFLIFLTRC